LHGESGAAGTASVAEKASPIATAAPHDTVSLVSHELILNTAVSEIWAIQDVLAGSSDYVNSAD
jgi:hypothetical protein